MTRFRALLCAACAIAALSLHAATFTVSNTTDAGSGSLRQAITDANALAGADRIVFSIGSGAQLIALKSVLPAITDPVTIDGSTQPGYSGTPIITVDGSSFSGAANTTGGFLLNATSSVIGLAITGFRVPSAEDASAVIVAAPGCAVYSCYLGVQRDGNSGAANDIGVRIDSGSVTVGAPGKGNVISASAWGIYANVDSPSTIANNVIGFNAAGSELLVNTESIRALGSMHIINNRIAGKYDNIIIGGAGCVVKGNKVGVFANGTTIPTYLTSSSAVDIYSGDGMTSSDVVIGGAAPGEGNEIASAYNGIIISGTPGVQIIGNDIHHDGYGIKLYTAGTRIIGNTIHNNGSGVSAGGSLNLISRNSFYSNEKAIELTSGSNYDRKAPVLTSARSFDGSTTIEGTLSDSASAAYTLEFFYSPACESGGVGKTYAGSASTATDASGHAAFSASFAIAIPQGSVVTATTTDADGNTSAFSRCASIAGVGSFSISAATVVEASAAIITVSRINGSSGTVSVDYSTASGTAIAGSDFTAKSGTLVFAPGETQKTISIPTIEDSIYEGVETFFVNLSNPTGGSTIAVPSVRVTLFDNDEMPVISVGDLSAPRPASGSTIVTFVVRLSGPAGAGTGFSYHTENGTALAGVDYQTVTGTAAFNPGETSKSINVTLLSNDINAPTKDFAFLIAASGVTPQNLTAHCTIFAHDVSIAPLSQSLPNGGKGTVTITFGRPLAADVTLVVKSSRPESFSVPATVPMTAGMTSTSFQVTALTAPASGRIDVTIPASLGGDVVTSTVQSYEKTTLVLQPSPLSVSVGATATVTATLSPASDAAQFIVLEDRNASVADGASSVTIPAGGSGTFTVAGMQIGDALIHATLPARYGSLGSDLQVHVTEAPKTPVLFSISPATGPSSGGTNVIASGARLDGTCSLKFGGVAAQSTYVNDGQLNATTPAHGAGTVDVVLTCAQATFALTNAFTFINVGPQLSSVSPAYGNVAGGTIVQLAGTNLSSACGVLFGISPAHNVATDKGALIATAPAHQPGAVDVTVRCGTDSVTRNGAFTFTTSDEPAAAISSVDPLSGMPGQSVTISGLRFRAGDRVVFGTTPAPIVSTTGSEHVVRIPDVPAGPIAITLTDPNERVTTTGPIFTITAPPALKITKVTPSATVAGAEVLVEGEGFRSGYGFALGITPVALVSMSSTQALIRLPMIGIGSYAVSVTDRGGNSIATGPSVSIGTTALAVTGVSTTCATTDGDGAIVIRGNGFAAGAVVAFGDVIATNVTVVDPQTISATIPPSASAGVVRIAVTNPNGSSASLTNAFRYTSPYDPDGCGTRRRPGGR